VDDLPVLLHLNAFSSRVARNSPLAVEDSLHIFDLSARSKSDAYTNHLYVVISLLRRSILVCDLTLRKVSYDWYSGSCASTKKRSEISTLMLQTTKSTRTGDEQWQREMLLDLHWPVVWTRRRSCSVGDMPSSRSV
jgi:hypothetical protein